MRFFIFKNGVLGFWGFGVLGNKVRVGIDAPDNISIVRGELIRNTVPDELSVEDKPIAIRMTVTHHHN